MRLCTLALCLAACTSTPPAGDGASEADTRGETTTNTTNTATTTGDPSSGTTAGLDTSGSAEGSTTDEPMTDYGERGPYGVGVRALELPGADGRMVRVTLWYPSDSADGEVGLEELVEAEHTSTFTDLLTAAPAGCTRPTMSATADAPLAAGTFPGIVFSHCLSCLGLSSTFITERLASHGSIVAGVTHTGDTLFEQLEGNVAPLEDAWLTVRAEDVGLVLDGVLALEPFGASIDTERIGVFGHSYGAATTGRVLQDDDRFIAGVAIAAPVANPLLPSVAVSDIAEPMLLLLAQEDNSITELGNGFIRTNAMELPGGSWLVELADAGHWSFSDLCGIVEAFEPGCGDGLRQTVPGEPFTYLDNALARDIAASYVTAFFALHLHGDAAAEGYLDVATPAEVVTVVRHEP